MNFNSGTCDPCHKSCKGCIGKEESQCIYCKTGLFNHPMKMKCVSDCGPGYA